MEIFIAFVIGIVMGILLTSLMSKKDGRLVIDDDEYFVAIATPPEDLEKRKWLRLKIVVTDKGAHV